jgi:hypothetical protein
LAILLSSPACIPTPGTFDRRARAVWRQALEQPEGVFTDPFFLRINPNKTLGFLTQKNDFLRSHHNYSQSFLRKTCVSISRIFFRLVFVWFQKIKQVIGFLQSLYVPVLYVLYFRNNSKLHHDFFMNTFVQNHLSYLP